MDLPPVRLSRIARSWPRCAAMLLVAGLLAMLAPAEALAKRAIVLGIDGAIGPAVAEYIVRELHAADPGDTGLIVCG